MQTSDKCRLCGKVSRFKFELEVLAKYRVGYYECSACGSLQTEQPHWLNEAYAIPGVHIDVGQAARIIQTWIRMCYLLESIGFKADRRCVDYGGSSGLLTRLMRDAGYDYFSYDAFDSSKYANYFALERLESCSPELVSAFEVFEHFPDPSDALTRILTTQPGLVVFSTQFYEGQGKDWDYLVPSCGQHVFFYRERALEQFCTAHGYTYRRGPDFCVLLKAGSEYLPKVEAWRSGTMPPDFAGRLVTRTGYGTDATSRDHAYAKDRFERELSARGAPVLDRIRRLFSSARQASGLP